MKRILDILKTNVIKEKGLTLCNNFRDASASYNLKTVQIGSILCGSRCKSKMIAHGEREYYECKDFKNESS